jgi:hypothetical protein
LVFAADFTWSLRVLGSDVKHEVVADVCPDISLQTRCVNDVRKVLNALHELRVCPSVYDSERWGPLAAIARDGSLFGQGRVGDTAPLRAVVETKPFESSIGRVEWTFRCQLCEFVVRPGKVCKGAKL